MSYVLGDPVFWLTILIIGPMVLFAFVVIAVMAAMED